MAAKMKVDIDFGDENLKELKKHKAENLDFVTNIETKKLVAITILNCNALYSYSFTDAQVQRKRNVAFVYYKTLFEIEILRYFFENAGFPEEMEDKKKIAVISSLKLLGRYLAGMEISYLAQCTIRTIYLVG